MSSFLFIHILLIAFVLAQHESYVSCPSSLVWHNYSKVISHPEHTTSYTITIRNTTSHFEASGVVCTPLYNQTSNTTICKPFAKECIELSFSPNKCSDPYQTESTNLRSDDTIVKVRTDDKGWFKISKHYDYPLSLEAQSVRIGIFNNRTLLCNEFTWQQTNSTDASITSTAPMLFSLFSIGYVLWKLI